MFVHVSVLIETHINIHIHIYFYVQVYVCLCFVCVPVWVETYIGIFVRIASLHINYTFEHFINLLFVKALRIYTRTLTGRINLRSEAKMLCSSKSLLVFHNCKGIAQFKPCHYISQQLELYAAKSGTVCVWNEQI